MTQRGWFSERIFIIIVFLSSIIIINACKENSSSVPLILKISSITPEVGLPGDTVNIRGIGFSKMTSVTFNETPADVIFISSTFIKALVPKLVSSGPIIVTTGEDKAVWSDFSVEEVSAKIVFSSNRSEFLEIWIMDANGVNPVNLSNDPNGIDDNPRWSPDGTKIMFKRRRVGNDHSDIWVMDADGSNQTNLTNNPDFSKKFARWSPDGKKIVYEKNNNIWVMDQYGNNKKNLTKSDGGILPSWSPDGTKIAFEKGGDIWTMSAEGTNKKNLTKDTGAREGFAEWSPDGSKILFVKGPPAKRDILVINSDGTNQINLTNDTEAQDLPQWSLDGTSIAFLRWRGTGNIWVMDENGKNQRNLTSKNRGDIQVFMWSSDGRYITFEGRAPVANIWVIDSDGANLTKMTNNSSWDMNPHWRPE